MVAHVRPSHHVRLCEHFPRNGKPHFTMMSLHLNNSYAKKRGIAKIVLVVVRTAMQQVDMVAGDFKGAAWRRKRGEGQQCVSTIEEAFADTNLLVPLRPYTPVVDGVPDERSDVCGRFRNRMTKKTHAWCVRDQSRGSWHQAHQPELPSRGLDPLIARHRVAGHS